MGGSGSVEGEVNEDKITLAPESFVVLQSK